MSKTFKDKKLSPEEKLLLPKKDGDKRSRLRELVDEEWEEEYKWLKA